MCSFSLLVIVDGLYDLSFANLRGHRKNLKMSAPFYYRFRFFTRKDYFNVVQRGGRLW